MISLAHRPAVFGIPAPAFFAHSTRAKPPMRLLPSGDGWSLVGQDGKLIFHAMGVTGRRRCLEYAYGEGVLAVFS